MGRDLHRAWIWRRRLIKLNTTIKYIRVLYTVIMLKCTGCDLTSESFKMMELLHDPSCEYCHGSEDHEHHFVEVVNKK